MKVLCVLCFLCGMALPGVALDREAFTFTSYDLDVRVEPEQQRLGVRGKIKLRNDSATPQKDIVLQISSTLDWRSIQFAGKTAQFVAHEYTSDIDHTGELSEAIVTLPDEIPSKGQVELEIGYEGVIPLDATRLTRIGAPEDKARHTDWDQISKNFTAVRGVGCVAWYPIATESANLSEGSSVAQTVGRWKSREQQATMDVNFCTTGDANTTHFGLMNERIEGVPGASAGGTSGSKTIALCSKHRYQPVGDVVPTFVEANYAGLGRAGIYFHFFPEHKPGMEDYALAAELATPLVQDWFGAPKYKAELVELSDPEAAPFESGTMLLMPLNSGNTRLYGLSAAHQLTHAAFFSPRSWIYEGLAHFAQALEREQQDGRQSAVDFMASHRTAIVDAERTLAGERNQAKAADESLINTYTEEFYRSKAMYVWWMLRDMVGDSALKKALATYHVDQDKESSYMQRLIEAQTHRDLEWFFDDWVYRDRGLPDFRVESAYPRATVDGGYVVTVVMENLGESGAEVPVILRMASGEVRKRLEVNAKSKASVRIEASSTPVEVEVNDGSVLETDLSNNIFKIPPPEAAK